ncbi:MAG: iron ABC transporter permease [Methanospirillaceae archaeon]|nr:iron ABC transporter permease [Methanospirillaceae archaeon]
MEHPKSYKTASKTQKKLVMWFLFCTLIVLSLLSITLGTYEISVFDIYFTLGKHLTPFYTDVPINKLYETIIWKLRFPRIILAIVVGMSLAIAGAVYQSVFRNPLVEPYILGVSSGAAFGAALAIVFSGLFLGVQVMAFLFGGLAVMAAYYLASQRGETPVIMLVLSGVIISSLFMAFVSILKYTADTSALREIVFWMMGGFYYATWEDVVYIIPILAFSFAILWYNSWKLNVLSMGDEEAKSLGVNPEKTKFIAVALATLVTAFSVSLVGIVAWIGLMMPHAARMLLGPDNRYVIPTAALMGGTYLIICDTIARTFATHEIPIGIITSIIGAPYLCYLIKAKGKVLFGGA